MTFLDTNIFLRFLTPGDETKAEACRALFQRLDQNLETATTSESVIAEVVYVLSNRSVAGYGLTPVEVAARLRPLLQVSGLQLSHKSGFERALDIYASQPFLDFEDALTVAHMQRQGIVELLSYDHDFDKVSGVKRIEPIDNVAEAA